MASARPALLLPVLGLVAVALSGCQGWQSSLDAHGPAARDLAGLFWMFAGILAAVWLAVMVALVFALRRRRAAGTPPLATNPSTERRMTMVVSAAVAATFLTVVALTLLSYRAQASLFANTDGAITIKVVGHQWWWEVTYEDPQANLSFTTANEIHLPVGEPVRVKLESADVIHSFWIPSLTGKMDAITGRQNQIEIQADRPGVYRGQCAEFCGFQHAHMGILVVAEEREAFDAWRSAQVASAAPPDTDERKRGQEVFLTNACVSCHQIRGTDAAGKVGPDLTHIGSRRFIAAGTLERSPATLAAWIADPQRIKPGVHMPPVPLPPEDLLTLAAYLEGLK